MKNTMLVAAHFIICGLLIPAPAHAEPTKGVQAVLLQCWFQDDVDRLIGAVKESGVTEFELSSSPFLDDVCTPLKNEAGDYMRYRYMRRVVDGLSAAKIAVRVVAHLGDLHDRVPSSHLTARTRDFWKVVDLYRDTAGVSFHVTPSLEDELSDTEATTAFRDVARAVPDPALLRDLIKKKRFGLRRSAVKDSVAVEGARTVDVTLADGRTLSVPIRYETHATAVPKGTTYLSNDGDFVRDNPDTEDCYRSNGDRCGTETTLSSLLKLQDNVVTLLLWRPAYNLFFVKSSGGVATYSQPPGGNRTGNSRAARFNDRERTLLVKFLKN